jgi:hypothetical protein
VRYRSWCPVLENLFPPGDIMVGDADEPVWQEAAVAAAVNAS